MESWGLRGGALKHLSDAVLESVMVFRLAAGAVAEVVVPLGHCVIILPKFPLKFPQDLDSLEDSSDF